MQEVPSDHNGLLLFVALSKADSLQGKRDAMDRQRKHAVPAFIFNVEPYASYLRDRIKRWARRAPADADALVDWWESLKLQVYHLAMKLVRIHRAKPAHTPAGSVPGQHVGSHLGIGDTAYSTKVQPREPLADAFQHTGPQPSCNSRSRQLTGRGSYHTSASVRFASRFSRDRAAGVVTVVRIRTTLTALHSTAFIRTVRSEP